MTAVAGTAIGLIGAVLVGFVVPLQVSSGPLMIVAVGACLLPIVVIITSGYQKAVTVLLLAVVPLEAFEVPTPLGHLSAAVLLVACIVAIHHSAIFRVLSRRNHASGAAALVVLWLVCHFLQGGHTPLREVASSMSSLVSYVAVWLVGIWIGSKRNIGFASAGAIVALLALGFLGILASYGVIPAPSRISEGRQILGITSPLIRNYGLNVPYDAVALLVPIAFPMALYAFLWGSNRQLRTSGGLVTILLMASFLFVFQSRGLILQAFLALTFAGYVRASSTPARAGIVLVALAAFYAFSSSLSQTDTVSSSLRADGQRMALDIIFNEPSWLLWGVSDSEMWRRFQEFATWAVAVESQDAFQPIHNIFLYQLVSGGVILGGLFFAIWLSTALVVTGLFRTTQPHKQQNVFVLSCGFLLMSSVLLIEPISSNAFGLWVLLGMVVGFNHSRSDPKLAALESETSIEAAMRPAEERRPELRCYPPYVLFEAVSASPDASQKGTNGHVGR